MSENNKMITCKTCNAQIAKNAKVCPFCGAKNKKSFYKRPWFIVLVVIVILCIIGSASGGSDDTDNTSNTSQNTSSSNDTNTDNASAVDDTDDSDEVENSDDASESSDGFYNVGDTFTVGDLQITFDDYVENYTDYEDEYGWYAPEDGYMYIKVDVTYKNVGDDSAYISIYDFECYADDEIMNQSYGLDSDDFVNANMSAGRSKSFSVYYQVPTDCESIELEYVSTNIWTGDEVYTLKCK